MMKWQCGRHSFDNLTPGAPLVMGILNVTPDSFSDGGQYADVAAAVAKGLQLREQGADIVDIGGESTRPGAAAVSAEEEMRRVLPVTEQLAAAGVVVSVDTMKATVMCAALQSGASIINDVGGFTDPAAVAAVADSDCGVVIMHKQGNPATMQQAPYYDDVVADVGGFLRQQKTALVAAGVAPERICVDPGIGFGKTLAHNTALLRHLPALANDCPLLIGVSRKSVFAHIVGNKPPDERDAVSAVVGALSAWRGAAAVRVHNVAMTADILTAARLITETADAET